MACNVATGVLLARLLLPESRGLLAAIMFWPGLLSSVGMLSLDQAVAHRVARAPALRGETAATAMYLALALCCLMAGLAAMCIPSLLGVDRRAWWLATQVYVLAFIPVTYLGAVFRALDYGELRLLRYNLWRVVAALAYLSGLSLMGLLDLASVPFALWSSLLSVALIAVIPMAYRAAALANKPSREEARHLIRLAMPFHGTNLASLFASQIDRVLIVLVFDDAAIGLYVVAVTWAGTGLHAVYSSFCTVMFPYIAADADPQRQRTLVATGLRYACLILVGATAALAIVTAWILPALFGAEFQRSIPIAYALTAAYLPWSVRQIMIYGLRGLGKAHPGTVAEGITIAMFIPFVGPLGIWLGLIGVPVAVLLANIVSLGYLIRYLERELELRPADWWGLTPATFKELVRLAVRYLALWRASP